LDGVFTTPVVPGGYVLGDIKSADPEDAAAHLQTVAYAIPWDLDNPTRQITERWAIWLRPGRRRPYTLVNYMSRPDHWLDRAKWEACLTTYREQAGRRARVALV